MRNRSRRKSRRVEGVQNEDFLYDLIENPQCNLLLALDCVQDPHNLGACLRTADAAGVGAVFAPKNRSVSVTETVRKVAQGAAEEIPFINVTNMARTLNILKKKGFVVIGTSDAAKKSLYEVSFSEPTVLVMGSEGTGLRRLTGETCDEVVQIPMRGFVNCLNISVATGVCLFEIQRQKGVSSGKIKQRMDR